MHGLDVIILKNARAAGREAAAAWEDGRHKEATDIGNVLWHEVYLKSDSTFAVIGAYNAGYDSVRPEDAA